VRELTLDIDRGQFFTMLGPSGCGKTTTLRMIAGFEEPTEGSVLLDGENVTGLPAFKRPTNTVFQSYALFPHLSVERNVAFGLERRKVGKAEIRSRVAEELERVGLSAEAKRKPSQLSGGQQQRVALARALVNRPAVLLLDEPLGALDLKLRKQLQVELKRIQRDVGITFVYVTHDQEEALTMSDRIAVMNRGVIEQVDVPERVYERPGTTFVAGFIGVSNLMPGDVVSANGGGAELRLDAGVTVRCESARANVGERAHAVVRPEKLELYSLDQGPPADRPSVEGIIESSIYLGTATQVVVKLGDGTAMTVLVPNTDEAARQRMPGAGARVRLAWANEHIHIVRGAESGESAPAPLDTAEVA
jgi:spermidine/putrescine transport system ATP-binding protein